MTEGELLRQLTPLCTCDGVSCDEEECAGCAQLDPEWPCLSEHIEEDTP